MFTERLTEQLTIPVASLYSGLLAGASQGGNNNTISANTNPVNAKNIKRFMGHVVLGTLGANVTGFTAVFQGSTANNGTFTNVAGGATLTLNTTNSDGTIEMRSDQLAGNNWVQLAVYVTTNTNLGNTAAYSATMFGGELPYRPAAQFDFSTNTSLLNRQVM